MTDMVSEIIPNDAVQADDNVTVYRYYAPLEHHFATLARGSLYWSHRSTFNDEKDSTPLDIFWNLNEFLAFSANLYLSKFSAPSGKPGDTVIDRVREWVGEYRCGRQSHYEKSITKNFEQFGILCTCESDSNELMWREYADNGKGFVLALTPKPIPVNEINNALDMHVSKIAWYMPPMYSMNYVDSRLRYFPSNNDSDVLVKTFLCHKLTSWSDEQEVRFFIKGAAAQEHRVDVKNVFHSIILGRNATEENKVRLIKIVENLNETYGASIEVINSDIDCS